MCESLQVVEQATKLAPRLGRAIACIRGGFWHVARPMRRFVALSLLSSALLSFAGCKSPCRELSERLCDCVELFDREDCLRTVAVEESNLELTAEQQEVCEQRLTTCNIDPNDRSTCALLETDEGKQACGLAR